MYKISNTVIPQNKRKEINEKILYLIENNLTTKYNITAENVYNSYTGFGGLHGLNYYDYDSYHAFSEAKKEIELGAFFTPHDVSKFLVDCVKPSNHDLIADLTCGMGNFFNWLPNHSNVYGCEIDIRSYKVAKFLYPDINITADDIRNWATNVSFDLVLGNPPFNLKWNVGKEEYLSQLYYCLKAYDVLKPAGILALIVPVSFLVDDFTDSGMIKTINNRFNFIYQVELPSDVFKNVGVSSYRTKIMFFQKKSEHITVDKPYSSQLLITEIDQKSSDFIYNTYIKPVIEQKEKVKHKLFFESLHSNSDDLEFQAKVTKYLYDIKRNPNINKNYAKCIEYVNRYHTQTMPEGMKFDEWQKVRLTKEKVLSYLKRIIKNQHNSERDEIRLVKTNYGLRLKGYSQKDKIYLSKYTGVKEMSFTDMILSNSYPFDDQTYKKLYNRKVKKSCQQSESFKKIGNNPLITEWLENFRLYNNETNQTIQLKDFQKEDLGKILQKDKALLAWNVGLGKTEAGITWMKYMNQHKHIRNTFIVSSSISIKMTWTKRLDQYGIKYKKIESLSDVLNLKQGDTVLFSFNMLVKYQKHIKHYIRLQSRKIALILDESHRCIYPSTKTTKAVTSVFQRVPYKLLASGTPTKNNANELYPQFMILYGSSNNFICECPTIQQEDKKTGELKENENKYYMKPFPAYNQSLFSACFSPKKATVFGVEKANQDIYHSDKLIKLIEKTIIVRSMFEVLNKDMVEFVTHRINQNENEKEVYRQIMEEFHTMVRSYYGTTGNYRKDAMLRIIQQIQLLQKAVSIPHKLKEYNGYKEPNKYKKIKHIIKNADNQKVAIGTTFIDASTYYFHKLRDEFSDRKVFLILGETSFKKRTEIIEEFEATENGILVSTQMSLSESVNIPSCDVAICEGLQYNIANMMQYIGRFTRLNSKNKTTIHFITYTNTLEQNILALLMAKQRINEFVKQCEYKEDADIFDEFGISLDIFNSIITKEYDENGSVKLSWGRQNVI
ncbi:helicase-related protein [Paenibacillus naphthalenovorans]|uniref:N12 class N6 adenine-specific DNA methyltransferase n=1 Tax=Paenibacillus naphthalenovorans TaxID=162209 RepID=A0A0U2VRY3_9BACL|nr:helicase-related protein [Paenibacillus naphthalenovorans]ALS22263.1 N12 class N6 adenine-specific DNA methyltransferase [Paenibacillus naphthalenovorans]